MTHPDTMPCAFHVLRSTAHMLSAYPYASAMTTDTDAACLQYLCANAGVCTDDRNGSVRANTRTLALLHAV